MGVTPGLYLPTITIDTVCEALASFLVPFVGTGTPIIRAYDNETAPPSGAYVELTEILQVDLETPSATYSGATQVLTMVAPKRIDVQIDFYGPSAGDQAAAVKSVFRTAYAASQFPDGIAPLYTDDGHCIPLVTGEKQWDYRWSITASLQYNPAVSLPQQSATAVSVTTLEGLP